MIRYRILAIVALCTVSTPALLRGEERSQYRTYVLGMDVSTVLKLADKADSDLKVIHQRPALIQVLQWGDLRSLGPTPSAMESVRGIQFHFCNGSLYQLDVLYDRNKTEALTDEDLIQTISATYGAATQPDAEILFPAVFPENVKVLARWEDSKSSLNLVRSPAQSVPALIFVSKAGDSLAQTAIVAATKIEEEEAPQVEAARQKKADDTKRMEQEKTRATNKARFHM